MPIKDKSKYPANWGKIRQQILLRAGNKCECCNVKDGLGIVRGTWEGLPAYQTEDCAIWCGKTSNLISTGDSDWHKFNATSEYSFKIVLTIAHIDQDTFNNDPNNLKALCQKCHFALDAPYNLEKRQETLRARKKAKTMQIEIFQ